MDHSIYNHQRIEKKWQEIWDKESAFKSRSIEEEKPKKYILEMLPYPSGKIHMGHLRNYTIGDVMARMYRKMGFNVLYTLGWDAFGLPAENAAIQSGIAPQEWTVANIADMKRQLLPMGFSYDWGREISTCEPEYYKHEQKFFTEFYRHGLVYQKEAIVNWDPVDKTVLANEQVIEGRGWRSGALVEQKKLKQWFLKITDFAEDLLKDLDLLQGWPEKVISMQRNWIGKSEGVEVDFEVRGYQSIRVFTTRSETLFGASFIGISPDHKLIDMIEKNSELLDFLEYCKNMPVSESASSTAEKKGFDTGLFATHPLDKDVKLPVFICNFILPDYGTGAIFGCPAHDTRDHQFAITYSLPIKQVVYPEDKSANIRIEKEPYLEDGVLANSKFLDGLSVSEAKKKIINNLEGLGIGAVKTSYRLRDWGVSRQRYWGCPIPIIHCDNCGIVPVPESDLPVMLPKDVDFSRSGNPLEYDSDWKNVKCPKCSGDAVRDTDTLDTFFESSWYFLRYCSPSVKDKPFDPKEIEYWMPVDNYIGGVEHAVMHLLYARFFTKALKKLGYVGIDEPFINLLTQGMVNHETYKNQLGEWLYPDEIAKQDDIFIEKRTGEQVVVGRMEKMSKSKKNVVEPSAIIKKYGADAVRLFILSDSPVERDFEWNVSGLEGCYKYLQKVFKLVDEISCLDNVSAQSDEDKKLISITNKTIQLVTSDLLGSYFNKAIAKLRELTNFIQDSSASAEIKKDAIEILIRLLNPICPHITEEMADILCTDKELLRQWLVADTSLIAEENVTIAIQINGKLKGTINIAKGLTQEKVEELCLGVSNVKNSLTDKTIKKIVYIPNKIINIVCY